MTLADTASSGGDAAIAAIIWIVSIGRLLGADDRRPVPQAAPRPAGR